MDPLDSFDAFTVAVRARLQLGAEAYRSRPSSSRPLPELADQLAAECEDLAGWAACLWPRLRQLSETLQALETCPIGHTNPAGPPSDDWERMFHVASRRVDELRDQLAKQSLLRVAAEQRAGQRHVVALEARLAELEGRTA